MVISRKKDASPGKQKGENLSNVSPRMELSLEKAAQHSDRGADIWPEEISREDAASYINDIALEMKRLAESSKLKVLSHLLELVIEESAIQKRARL